MLKKYTLILTSTYSDLSKDTISPNPPTNDRTISPASYQHKKTMVIEFNYQNPNKMMMMD